MADVTVNTSTNDPKELTRQGIRALILQDFDAAVTGLGQACALLNKEHGDELHESLADVYLYYGKALLGLSREQSEPLGDAVPKNEDSEDEDNAEEGDEEEDGDKDEAENEVVENKESGPETSNGDKKEEEDGNEGDADQIGEDKPEADEASDLQLAWEVLELAKKIYQKQGDNGRKNLAETMIVLGEISLESENFEAAVSDIKEGLEMQKTLYGKDSRTIAESCYKLGIAFSTNSQIDEAIQSFEDALEYLRNRVSTLEKEDKKDEVQEEIQEIKSLIPEVTEKIADMKAYKDEAIKNLVSAVTNQKLDGGSSTASASSSSSAAPVNNISHLVKRKRKEDEPSEQKEEAGSRPAKKPSI